MKKITIKVENSAPSQKIPAKSISVVSEFLKKYNINSIVDFGCGRLRNLPIFRKYYKDILLVETRLQCDKISKMTFDYKLPQLLSYIEFQKVNKKFDAIFLILVIHVIPEYEKRLDVLKSIKSKIKKDGFLIIDVPTGEKYYRKNCNNDNKYKDGWILGKGENKTFYKQYTANELDEFVLKSVNMKVYKKIGIDKHLVRIYTNGV